MRALAALLLIATMAGCHAAPSAPLVAKARVAQHAAIRDTGDPLADAAQADLAVIDATFHALGLDTASGRKLTPERDRALIPGLATLVQQLDADMAAMTARLAAAGTPQATAAQQVLDRYHPLAGEALLVVDEAYGEYAGVASAASLAQDAGNIVVLRTLSKAHALAGARIGCAIATPAVASALRRCQAPYPLSAPSVAAALSALAPDALAHTQARVRRTCIARDRLAARLRGLPAVRRVDASGGNFLLLRLADAEAALARLRAAGIAVRDMRAVPGLDDAVRATVGTARQNAALFDALAQAGERA